MRTRALMIVALGGACGRSPTVIVREPLRCDDDRDDRGTGCSFVVTPGTHLAGALAPYSSSPGHREPDAAFVVNPHATDVLWVDVADIFDSDDEPWSRPQRLALGPGERAVVELPRSDVMDGTVRRRGGAILLDGSAPFFVSAYRPFRSFEGNDSEWVLPTEAWGTSYVVASYPPHPTQFQGAGEPSFFEVVALRDGTEVRWRPKQDTAGDGRGIPPVAAGQWSDPVVLSRYESMRVAGVASLSELWAGDVSGTQIEASARVAVVAGSRCSSVPPSLNSLAGCDPLSDQMIPVALWGDEVAVPHPPLQGIGTQYLRVFAGRDDLTVVASPPDVLSPTVLARRGDWIDVTASSGTSFALDADGPMLVVAYLGSRLPPIELGDPSMYQLVPTERFLRRYVVATGNEWTTHLLQMVRSQGAAPVVVDGVVVEEWEGFAGFETATVEVDEGAHVVESDDAFGLTQLGWTNRVHPACTPFGNGGFCHTSYAHPGGMKLRPLP